MKKLKNANTQSHEGTENCNTRLDDPKMDDSKKGDGFSSSLKKTSVVTVNWYDLLKVFAIGVMIIDHMGYYLFSWPEFLWMRLIGRFAFPLFLFLVGFNGSYRWRWSLFIVALLVQFATIMIWQDTGIWHPFTLNILRVVLFARVILSGVAKLKWSLLVVMIVFFLFFAFLITESGFVYQQRIGDFLDYGLLGFGFAIAGFFMRSKGLSFIKQSFGYALLPVIQNPEKLSSLLAQSKQKSLIIEFFLQYIGGVVLFVMMFRWLYTQNVFVFHFSQGWMLELLSWGYVMMFAIIIVLTFPQNFLLWMKKSIFKQNFDENSEKNLNDILIFQSFSRPKILSQILIFFSRNALWIYGLHMVVLMFLFRRKLKSWGF